MFNYKTTEVKFIYLLRVLGPHVWHMEVHMIGVESELLLPAFTATATPDLSCICDLRQSSWQCQILTHWGKPGIKSTSSWILVRFLIHWTTTGTTGRYHYWLWCSVPLANLRILLNTGLGSHSQLCGVDPWVATYSVVTGQTRAYLRWEWGFPAVDQTHPSLQNDGGEREETS